MTGLGIIPTAAAWLNYNNVKAEYDALVEQSEGLQAAVVAFNQGKNNPYYKAEAKKIQTYDVEYMPGVQMTTLLRVGNLVGKNYRVQASIVLVNTSEKSYQIKSAEADCRIYDVPVMVYKIDASNFFDIQGKEIPQVAQVNRVLRSGETMEITLPCGISALPEEQREQLKRDICDAAGKKLITSCPKINIEGIETANILVTWSDGEKEYNAARKDVAGVLRYCMEAFYPKD